MSVFKIGKDNVKKKESSCCCCGGKPGAEAAERAETPASGDKGIKVLGSGCEKCRALEASAVEAVKELGMDDEIGHVTDFAQIAAYGVMSTPALVVDGKVVSYGKVLKKDEVIKILKDARGV